MLSFGLVCLLHNHDGFKTVTAKKGADAASLLQIYAHNLQRTSDIIDFCHQHDIGGYRVSSNLFPLLDHPEYASMASDVLQTSTVQDAMKKIRDNANTYNIHLSLHPDQFCLLSSLRDDVNQKSLQYLELHNNIADKMGIQTINIHGGSVANGIDEHYRIFHDVCAQMSQPLRQKMSFENDEKSYSVNMLLEWCEKESFAFTYDAHHERCYQRHKNNLPIDGVDATIEIFFERIIATWEHQNVVMGHLSSPRGTWSTSNFREYCSHHDYIDDKDLPVAWFTVLNSMTKKAIIDIEAKNKQDAIFQLKSVIINNEQ